MADRRLLPHGAGPGAPVDRSSSTPLSPSSSSAGFEALGVPAQLTKALATAGVVAPFPVQAATLPDAIAGRDVLGRGRTGSGNTLAFVLPVLIRLAQQPQRVTSSRPRALILAPTRELAHQILQVIEPLAWPLGLRSVAVFGGVAVGPQVRHLRRGVDVVVACPGRLEDLIRSGAASLAGVEISVLDEADHMADLGFLPAVRRLLDQTPPDGQRLLFSATLDDAVDDLVRRYLTDPVVHAVDDDRSTGAGVTFATRDQHAEVARLGRRAGIEPQVTRHQPGHPILRQVAPGVRTQVEVTTPGFESRRRRRPTTAAGSRRGARTARRGR